MTTRVRRGYRFATVPEWVVFHPDLSPLAKLIYAVLDRHGQSPEDCYPGHDRIAECAHVAVRSVARPLAELEKVGAVVAVRRAGAKGHRTTDGYYLAADHPLDREAIIDAIEWEAFAPAPSTPRTGLPRAPARKDSRPTAHVSATPTARTSAEPAAAPLFPNESQGNEVNPAPPAPVVDAVTDAHTAAVKATAHALTKLAFEQKVKPVIARPGKGGEFVAVLGLFRRMLEAGESVDRLGDAVRAGIEVWTLAGVQTAVARLPKSGQRAGPRMVRDAPRTESTDGRTLTDEELWEGP